MPVQSRWIETRAGGNETIRLFCFPYAGGSSSQIYRGWQDDLPPHVGLYAVQLPGRGTRMGEPAISRMETLIAALDEALAPYLDRPFAFFGHSMGAAIAFEAALRLRGRDGRAASHLFASARRAPTVKSRRPAVASLSDDAFITRLRELKGTPEEVLREAELMALLMPMLRADFGLNDVYWPEPGVSLACPMTVYGGRGDPEALEHELAAWRGVAGGPFAMRLFPGDHYYFLKVRRELLEDIALRLNG